MAKGFFFNIPAHGHMDPTPPLVRELVHRDESITCYTGEDFEEAVETAGAEFRTYDSLGEAVRFQFEDDRVRSIHVAMGRSV
jgi:UDP:flavonoid glycosyltransferase YjiC (YdhE family)